MNDPRCLLADDHPALTVAVSAYLSENGFTVVGPAPAEGGEAFGQVHLARKFAIDGFGE